MGLIVPVTIAIVLGFIVFRKRISGVFVSIITLALVLLVRLVVIDAQPITNGFNGLTDLGWFKIGDLEFDPYVVPTYYLVAVSLGFVLFGARLLVETRAGVILQAVRDDQNRARYLGFDVPSYQTFFFSVSAGIAGFAGMLYVIVSEFASPTFMDLTFSITMVVWAAVGGRSSILGACPAPATPAGDDIHLGLAVRTRRRPFRDENAEPGHSRLAVGGHSNVPDGSSGNNQRRLRSEWGRACKRPAEPGKSACAIYVHWNRWHAARIVSDTGNVFRSYTGLLEWSADLCGAACGQLSLPDPGERVWQCGTQHFCWSRTSFL